MTRRFTYPDWAAEKRAEITLLGIKGGHFGELYADPALDALTNPPRPHHSGECAPDCVEAEPARRGSLPLDPEAPAGPFPTTGRKVAQPNYAALGLGSAEEAEGRN